MGLPLPDHPGAPQTEPAAAEHEKEVSHFACIPAEGVCVRVCVCVCMCVCGGGGGGMHVCMCALSQAALRPFPDSCLAHLKRKYIWLSTPPNTLYMQSCLSLSPTGNQPEGYTVPTRHYTTAAVSLRQFPPPTGQEGGKEDDHWRVPSVPQAW